MADLQGPKIRTGALRDGGPVELVDGAGICVTTLETPGDAERVSTTYPNLPRDVKPGDRLLLADGAMELRVERVDGEDVHCVVVRGGNLGEHKGINLPGVAVSAPSLTEKDAEDLSFAVGLGVDYVALSFVRKPEDIRDLRERMASICANAPERAPGVVAKIERPEALERIDEILPLTDAIMVARGDLGIEARLEDIPQIQKSLIRKCNARGIPVITATQMLESMIQNPRPTRAEVSDVANAIYDGTDAVMLSGETAAGEYPVEAAQVMAEIAERADEATVAFKHDGAALSAESDFWKGSHSGAIAGAVSGISRALTVARIICFTKSGFSARAIARCRPHTPITAVTLSETVLRRCALFWGVDALCASEVDDIDEMLHMVDVLVAEHGLAKKGDSIIIVGGSPLAVGSVTNFLKLHSVA
jgi:pyruvate kinase